jgi:hypothetical protein
MGQCPLSVLWGSRGRGAVGGGHAAGRGWDDVWDRRRGRPARGGRHQPGVDTRGLAAGGHARQGRPGGDQWAPATFPVAVKFNSKLNSNRFKLFNL